MATLFLNDLKRCWYFCCAFSSLLFNLRTHSNNPVGNANESKSNNQKSSLCGADGSSFLLVFCLRQHKRAKEVSCKSIKDEMCHFAQWGCCVCFLPLQVYLYPVPVQSSHTTEHRGNGGLIGVSTSAASPFGIPNSGTGHSV